MSINPYIQNPLYVAQIDPSTGKYISAYFFLGNVPNNILSAANNSIAKSNDPRIVEWNKKDSEILNNFYGKNWKQKLTASNPVENAILPNSKHLPFFFSYSGGDDEIDEIDEINKIDEIDEIDEIDDLESFEQMRYILEHTLMQ